VPGGDAPALAPEWLPAPLRQRLATAYGSRLSALLANAQSPTDLGRHFGAGLYEAEVRYLVTVEFARTAEDILWRRTKLGLHTGAAEQQALRDYLGG
jgi:glycerol-3-phosphate dehydrogenase